MIPPILITPPVGLPVSLEDARRHLRLTEADDDGLVVEKLIASAVAHLDGWAGILGRCLLNQTWQQDYHNWCDPLRLPFPDVSSVVLTYFDEDAAEQTVSDNLYDVLETVVGPEIRFKDAFTSPSLDSDRQFPVRAEVVAGYGAADDVPAPLRTAILMLMAHWYMNREAATADGPLHLLPMGVSALTAPYRRVGA